MQMLLVVLPSQDALQFCEEFMGKIDLEEDKQSPRTGKIDAGGDQKLPLMGKADVEEYQESAFFAHLSTFNTCTHYLVNHRSKSNDSTTCSRASRWSSLSRSWLNWIQDTEPEVPKGRPFLEWKLANLEIKRLSGTVEKATITKDYEEVVEEARQISDFSVQAGSLWAIHELDVHPDQDELKMLHTLQIDTMGDSLGYAKHLDKSLELYLQQHGNEGSKISIPEIYLTTSPIQQGTFNAPNLVEGHLQNRLKLGQLRKDDAEIDLAESKLQKLREPFNSSGSLPKSEARALIPLHRAVKRDNMADVKRCMNETELIDEKAVDGSTALHYAVERSQSLDITTLLLERGASPNVKRSTDGYAPLHVLVSTSYGRNAEALAILVKLISYKADIYARAGDSESVVGLAACQNLATPIQRLIREGADPNSIFKGYSKEAADPNSYIKGPRSALNIAAWHAHIETMKVLIDAGANVNNNASGQTPLLEIVCSRGASRDLNRYVEGAKMLLDAGADINSNAGGGCTVMLRAVYNGNLGLVKMLIGRGADPMAQTFENKSFVTHAIEQGHEDIAKYLQDKGLNSK